MVLKRPCCVECRKFDRNLCFVSDELVSFMSEHARCPLCYELCDCCCNRTSYTHPCSRSKFIAVKFISLSDATAGILALQQRYEPHIPSKGMSTDVMQFGAAVSLVSSLPDAQMKFVVYACARVV